MVAAEPLDGSLTMRRKAVSETSSRSEVPDLEEGCAMRSFFVYSLRRRPVSLYVAIPVPIMQIA